MSFTILLLYPPARPLLEVMVITAFLEDAPDFKSSFNRPNLYYEVRPKTKNVDKDIIKYIKSNPGKSGIIYCLSRKKVEELAEILQANEILAKPYHAGMDSAVRSQTQDDFIIEKSHTGIKVFFLILGFILLAVAMYLIITKYVL